MTFDTKLGQTLSGPIQRASGTLRSNLLVRPRAWWLNKVPLSISLVLLLLDGNPLDARAALVLVLVVLCICAIGNYGYALNDLYDVGEDEKAQRTNAAVVLGSTHIRTLIVGSAVIAECLAWLAAGWIGAAITLVELSLPLVYSVPPWRIKERKWMGVIADALAAHVYPAILAMLAADHFGLHRGSTGLFLILLLWSSAVGIRGILSHQLHTAERDRQGGLTTVVHDYGNRAIETFIVGVLLPLEVAGLAGILLAVDGGPLLWMLCVAYLASEACKILTGEMRVFAFRPEGQPYIPFIEEAAYKAWIPVVASLDAARLDVRYLTLIPIYWLLFRPHMRTEIAKLGLVARRIWSRLALDDRKP